MELKTTHGFRSCGGSAENFVVMLLNDAFHVIHTAVANFNCVFVENFVVPMVFRKVLLDQAQKYFSDVCLDVLTKRRIEPEIHKTEIWMQLPKERPVPAE